MGSKEFEEDDGKVERRLEKRGVLKAGKGDIVMGSHAVVGG